MEFFDPFQKIFWSTIGAAVLCGGIIGLERQVRGKPAGLRTSILVCLGTAIFIHLGAATVGPGKDPTFVLGQMVTGIGFLGAGVIISDRGVITGVTTAAVIWLLAGLGATVGFGYYKGAIALAVVTEVILLSLGWLQTHVPWLVRKEQQLERD